MAHFTLGIHYFTGYAVATDPASRERAEWPPHPARVFMAMAAAHFESGADEEEARSLQWLESLSAPTVSAPTADERPIVTTYVPVNDKPTGSGMLQSAVGLTRNKQQRTFPRVRPHNETVYLAWPDVEANGHRAALDRLCNKVTRIGHSSSLVQMWVADGVPDEAPPAWEPDDLEADVRLRVFGPGTLEHLERQYGENERAKIHAQIASLNEQKIGQTKANQKTIAKQIRSLEDELREPLRPMIGLWRGYRRQRQKLDQSVPETIWDPYLIVRRLEPLETHHRRLGLVTTQQLTAAMHKAVMSKAGDPVPEFISGHKPDGSPTDQPHLAYLPLGFVGSKHATGHLLGLAIAVPKELNREQRRQALAAVGQVNKLTIGQLGRWKLDRDTQGKSSLEPETWTGGEKCAAQWATVTPIAFDRHAKAKDPQERERELESMIQQSCRRIGLPEPLMVVVKPVSRHLGCPASHEFPRLPRKDGSERRHAHAILIFDEPVRGPIALGAGRYRGYGFCRPLHSAEVLR